MLTVDCTLSLEIQCCFKHMGLVLYHWKNRSKHAGQWVKVVFLSTLPQVNKINQIPQTPHLSFMCKPLELTVSGVWSPLWTFRRQNNSCSWRWLRLLLSWASVCGWGSGSAGQGISYSCSEFWGAADLGAIAWALGMTPALHWMSVFPRNAAARALIWQ